MSEELINIQIEKEEAKAAFSSIKEYGSNDLMPLAKMLIDQLVNIRYKNNTSETDEQFYSQYVKNILDTIKNINPADHVEAMIAVQMFSIHNAIMKNCSLAVNFIESTDIKTIEVTNLRFNMINKLARTFAMQMESLTRYRTKGQQKITVEHLQINSGGQAIIGSVNKTNITMKEREKVQEGVAHNDK